MRIFIPCCGGKPWRFIRKYPEIAFLLVGAQPSGRSCEESPWGQGSYRPTGVAGFRFSWLVAALGHEDLSETEVIINNWFMLAAKAANI
jgi:hypothetical protein